MDVNGLIDDDPTEVSVVVVKVLDVGGVAEKEEGEGVKETAEMVEDDVSRFTVEDPTEETVVTAEELNIEDAAEEAKEGEAVDDAAEDLDNTGGWFSPSHLDSEPTS